MKEQYAQFFEEVGERLVELESALLELEETPDNAESINQVFRCVHTIKGGAGMFGLDEIVDLTSDLESVLEKVRSGDMPATRDLLNLTFLCKDVLSDFIADPESGLDPTRSGRVTAGLQGLCEEPEGDVAPETGPGNPAARPDDKTADIMRTYRIRLNPKGKSFSAVAPQKIVEELCDFGPSRVISYADDVPMLGELDPFGCFLKWDIILTTDKGLDSIQDVFIFVEDGEDLADIRVVDEEGLLDAATDPGIYKRLGEILVERGDLDPEDLRRVLERRKPLGEMLTGAGLVSQSQVGSALAEQAAVREARTVRERTKTASSIRVGVDKLDLLVDLVGELVIAQVRLDQVAEEKADSRLSSVAEEIERLCSELRERALGLRMLPIGTTFNKFRRLARDLSVEMGKEIELSTHGAETELDKTVIERLNDPLVHLLRNSIDHGIELPEERVSNGKPAKGTIGLFAKQAGGEVHVVIQDDGKGMDRDAILKKAVDMGLTRPDAGLSDREIFNFIFAPGFSTAKKVTDVSGRGVGMDVVKKSIDSLSGSVEIMSRKGVGSTVTIRLPLTLAIIDGLQVRAGGEDYVIPLSDVEECVEMVRKGRAAGNGDHIFNLRGEAVPRVPLREWFRIDGTVPAVEQGVIVRMHDRHVAIAVDRIVGQRQTVIKSLGKVFGDARCFSGATIMGDGSMALILNVPSLIDIAEKKARP